MKESEAGSSLLLDACCLIEKRGVAYSMSLLALCGFHGRMDMVDLLLEQGAGIIRQGGMIILLTSNVNQH